MIVRALVLIIHELNDFLLLSPTSTDLEDNLAVVRHWDAVVVGLARFVHA